MESTIEEQPADKKLSSVFDKTLDKLDKEETDVDVPDDFFDDFSNNDFMAGLDVVDAWDDGLNVGPNSDKEGEKTEGNVKEEVKKISLHKETSKNHTEDKDPDFIKVIKESDKTNINEVHEHQQQKPISVPKSDDTEVAKLEIKKTESDDKNYEIVKDTKHITSPKDRNTVNKPDLSVVDYSNTAKDKLNPYLLVQSPVNDPETSSTDSDSNNKIDPKLDLTDFKLNSKCTVVLERDDLIKSFTSSTIVPSFTKEKVIEKLKAIKEDPEIIKGKGPIIVFSKAKNLTKEPRKTHAQDDVDVSLKGSNSKEDNKTTNDPKDSKAHRHDAKNIKTSKPESKDSQHYRDLKSRNLCREEAPPRKRIVLDLPGNRRDPERTKRDIQKNKEQVAKDKEAKVLDQKLRLVETGLVPPGTEMEVDLVKHEEDANAKRVMVEDLRIRIRGGERERREDRRERERPNRSSSREPISTKRRHSDQNKPFKRGKDQKPNTSSIEHNNLSVSQSPERQVTAKSNLLDRRGRYASPPTQREHSNSSRRTLNITEDMVRSLQSTDDGQQTSGTTVAATVASTVGVGKGERIPRRAARSRSRSRSYEKYRAYKKSPSPTARGYGAGGERLGGRPRLVGGREVGGKREERRGSRERTPPTRERQRDRDYKARERDRRSPRSENEPTQSSREHRSNRGGGGPDCSASPTERRKKGPTFLEELNEKLSKQQSSNPSHERRTFLEEIREKINQQSNFSIPFNVVQSVVPAPVPAPQRFHPPPSNPVVYDQSFFIGEVPMLRPPMMPMIRPGPPVFGMGAAVRPMMPTHMMQQRPMMHPPQLAPASRAPLLLPVPVKVEPPVPAVVVVVPTVQPTVQQQEKQQKLDKESIAKLFNDKQITLTDFLSITSKVAGSDKPVDITKKIKVISRCQDASKVMSKDYKGSGRFLMRKSLAHRSNQPTDHVVSSENKLISPFKRNPAVRFRFTSSVPQNDDMVYRTSVQLLLHKLGLPDGTEPIRDPTPDPMDYPQPEPDIPEPQYHHKPIIIQETKNLKSVIPTAPPPVIILPQPPPKKEVLQKMCQTDPVNLCRECKVRSQKKFVSVGCQYDEKMFVSVGTQVSGTEDTLTPARAHLQGLLKSRSLASLTPAQILAQVTTTKDPREAVPRDDFVSPDPKRGRVETTSPAGLQWGGRDEERAMMMSGARRDVFNNYTELQQQDRQVQMTMDMQQQQRHRLQQLAQVGSTKRDMNNQFQFSPGGNMNIQGGGPIGFGNMYGSNNTGGGSQFNSMGGGVGQFGGPGTRGESMFNNNSGMQGMSGGTNHFGGNQNNPNFGGSRYYN